MLSNIDTTNGFLSLLTVITFFIVGLKIMFSYRESKEKRFLLIGSAWIGISEPWWPSTVGFLLAVIFKIQIGEVLYFYLNFGLIDLFLLGWLIALNNALMIDNYHHFSNNIHLFLRNKFTFNRSVIISCRR
jgi:hypothetical protein